MALTQSYHLETCVHRLWEIPNSRLWDPAEFEAAQEAAAVEEAQVGFRWFVLGLLDPLLLFMCWACV